MVNDESVFDFVVSCLFVCFITSLISSFVVSVYHD